MNHQSRIALVFLAMLALGLGLIAYGSGIMTAKLSIGFVLLGWAVAWSALRLIDNISQR